MAATQHAREEIRRSRQKPRNPVRHAPRLTARRLRGLIRAARENVARAVDAGQLFSNWHIGTRIRTDILKLKRAEYGARIVSTLSRQLEPEFGRGYSEKSLRHMVRFAEAFPDPAIVSTLSKQLGRSHFLEIIYMKDDLQRDFYAEMCRVNGWPVRLLRERIDSLLYERTAISKKPDKLIRKELDALRKEDRITPDLIFRDPYILDFLGLKGAFNEKDLETAIVSELHRFLTELGTPGRLFLRTVQKNSIWRHDEFRSDTAPTGASSVPSGSA